MEIYNVLLVDDESAYFEMIEDCNENLKFFYAGDAETVKKVLQEKDINLILMDWNIGHSDGLDLVKELNSHYRIFNIPVIMLTGKIGDTNVVTALNGGADDYIAKPFSLSLLVSKIKANLRRKEERILNQSAGEDSVVTFDDNSLNVSIKGESFELRKKEFTILKYLFSNPDRCFSRSELNRLTSGNDVFISDRCVDTYVRFLRSKLKDHLEIKTVRGQGYKAQLK